MKGMEAGAPSRQGEEDGEARPPQDGPHPLLRQVHGCPLGLVCWIYLVQAALNNIVFLNLQVLRNIQKNNSSLRNMTTTIHHHH